MSWLGVNWTNVRLIFLREIRDQLRDRRTLFMIAVLPLLLYPALGIGMVQLTVLFTEQPRTVVLLGANELPADPPLLAGTEFLPEWFETPTDAEKLIVVTDTKPGEPVAKAATTDGKPDAAESSRESDAEEQATRKATLEDAYELLTYRNRRRELTGKLEAARKALEAAPQTDEARLALAAEVSGLETEERALKEAMGAAFAQSRIQVLIVVPEGFRGHLEELSRRVAARDGKTVEPATETDGSTDKGSSEKVDAEAAALPRPEILFNRADDKSYLAYNRVRDVFDAWEKEILKRQLERASLPQDLTHPVRPTLTNLALDEQIAANLWGKLFPALLVMMSITGAFYPAIDLVAGEKERGTMETLLICPATRTEIVLGKFLTVMSFSATTALLNLLSMGLTGRHILSMSAQGMGPATGDFGLPPLASMGWVLLLLVPLAAMFSALSLAFATFARSSKEGQYYLTPLLMVTLGLTVFCMSPGVELKPQYAVVPIANIALLLKGLLLSPSNAGSLMWYIVPVLGSSLLYSALALWWAIDQFRREEVLFREAERFEVSLWLRHVLRDKGPVPSFAQAVFCFVVMMLLQFGMMRTFQAASGADPQALLRALMIQQLALMASPALIMGAILTSDFRRTFRVRWPAVRWLGIAVGLAVLLHPLVFEVGQLLQERFFDPLPRHVREAMGLLLSKETPTWLVLLAFAVTPAICEELAFRGFILSGFLRGGRVGLAVTLSSVMFGIVHLIPQQVLNAAILGLLLGLLAVRSGSLLPPMLFHLLHNGMMVLHSLYGAEVAGIGTLGNTPFWTVREGALRYNAPLLFITSIGASLLIASVIRAGRERPEPVGVPAGELGGDVPAKKSGAKLSSGYSNP